MLLTHFIKKKKSLFQRKIQPTTPGFKKWETQKRKIYLFPIWNEKKVNQRYSKLYVFAKETIKTFVTTIEKEKTKNQISGEMHSLR